MWVTGLLGSAVGEPIEDLRLRVAKDPWLGPLLRHHSAGASIITNIMISYSE